jgi:hypothetical protein
MAVPASTWLTYDSTGSKQSFDDVVYNIAPTETPFASSLDRKSIHNVLHQWQTDTLAAAANNKDLEGDDWTEEAQTATSIWTNYTQISSKIIRVSQTQQAVDKWGRGKNELAYLVRKAGEELKRDIEFGLTQNTTANAGAEGTERQSRGLEGWIFTNDLLSAAGSPASPNPVPATNTGPTDGTARAFTETLLRSAHQLAWTEGGNPTVLMTGPFNRSVVDSFTGYATRTDDAKDKAITATVEVYRGPFGKLKCMPNRFQRERTAFLLDMDYWKLGVLRGMKVENLAKIGDAERKALVTEYTLISENEKASAAVRDLTAS